jgi:hypothetical protein
VSPHELRADTTAIKSAPNNGGIDVDGLIEGVRCAADGTASQLLPFETGQSGSMDLTAQSRVAERQQERVKLMSCQKVVAAVDGFWDLFDGKHVEVGSGGVPCLKEDMYVRFHVRTQKALIPEFVKGLCFPIL